ncbi:MAG: histidinol-phosphate transaminase [Spirochaetaceae bacterium]|jgi:histidinol-phosphate aminotransferase|nr:histidinol-phosphate transaminase [Spirochaetaceae bacterium]
MSVFWNERVNSLTPYIPGEQPRESGIIKLNTNENPYPPSPAVYAALRDAAVDTLRLYPDPCCTALRCAIAAKNGLQSENVFCGNGSDEVLAFAFGAFFGKERLLFPDITYSFYPVYANFWGINYREVPLGADWNINIKDYDDCSGGIIFANPNAPTGSFLKISQVKTLCSLALSKNAVIVIDEAYSAFAAETALPLLLKEKFPNLLIVRTFSKAYSLAGLRAGFALGHKDLICALERMRDSFNSYTLDYIAQKAALAAVNDHNYLDQTTAKIIAERERISAELKKRDYEILPSAANFIFAKHPALSGEAVYESLRSRGVLVRHFSKQRIKDFVRISIGTKEQMDALLNAAP